jgi:hypothetical protein
MADCHQSSTVACGLFPSLGEGNLAISLLNVQTVITVTDSLTGRVKTYTNPLGTPFKPIQDTSAFSCP